MALGSESSGPSQNPHRTFRTLQESVVPGFHPAETGTDPVLISGRGAPIWRPAARGRRAAVQLEVTLMVTCGGGRQPRGLVGGGAAAACGRQSDARSLENMAMASGKLGGVAGVFLGVTVCGRRQTVRSSCPSPTHCCPRTDVKTFSTSAKSEDQLLVQNFDSNH